MNLWRHSSWIKKRSSDIFWQMRNYRHCQCTDLFNISWDLLVREEELIMQKRHKKVWLLIFARDITSWREIKIYRFVMMVY
jgi:hypothetical protein